MITYNTIQSSLIFSDSPTSGNEEIFLVFMKEVYFPKLVYREKNPFILEIIL